ncbi:MAG TPA: hypothetical protein DCX73_09670 [Eubacterium sp.]|nr:hypothetical protein [Eubacterium sp.]
MLNAFIYVHFTNALTEYFNTKMKARKRSSYATRNYPHHNTKSHKKGSGGHPRNPKLYITQITRFPL